MYLSYHFSLNPFPLPLTGKPVDNLWDQVLLNKLSFHLSLFCFINFLLYTSLFLVSVCGLLWLVHLHLRTQIQGAEAVITDA